MPCQPDPTREAYFEPPKHERSPSAQMSLENKSQGSSKGDPCINLNLQPTLLVENSEDSTSPNRQTPQNQNREPNSPPSPGQKPPVSRLMQQGDSFENNLPEKYIACETEGDVLLENIDKLLARHTEGIEAIAETAADFEQTADKPLQLKNFSSTQNPTHERKRAAEENPRMSLNVSRHEKERQKRSTDSNVFDRLTGTRQRTKAQVAYLTKPVRSSYGGNSARRSAPKSSARLKKSKSSQKQSNMSADTSEL